MPPNSACPLRFRVMPDDVFIARPHRQSFGLDHLKTSKITSPWLDQLRASARLPKFLKLSAVELKSQDQPVTDGSDFAPSRAVRAQVSIKPRRPMRLSFASEQLHQAPTVLTGWIDQILPIGCMMMSRPSGRWECFGIGSGEVFAGDRANEPDFLTLAFGSIKLKTRNLLQASGVY
ncbi:hypothetical protein HGP14_31905 [Rhizobium sp. P32RR-XVIII]|uniref:hypothetical protein n=1 Tax=Rhizobium sp. P32RR-XVIII TaxID=2726738 RepID=UPI001456820B|nr:hypothetical protein [Rhizobium sp. P32RR-XVIII]NLS07841.1 hypothetical protein [Rhizobium sp. P32RR-XVIII]